MNSILTYSKYVAGLTIGAIAADCVYENYLCSKALKCMKKNQLAIVTSGAQFGSPIDFYNAKLNFSVVKISSEEARTVGVVYFIFNSYYSFLNLRPDDWSIEVCSKVSEDLTPIGQYLSHRETPAWYRFGALFGYKAKFAPQRIIRSAEKLPVMKPGPNEKSGYYSINLAHGFGKNCVTNRLH